MDHDRFFQEVDSELALMDDVNAELQILAQEAVEEMHEELYRDWLDAQLYAFYEHNFAETGWDL